jgi:hypothetical protein
VTREAIPDQWQPAIGATVTPHGNVPRVGEVGVVTEIHEIYGMLWADVTFNRPHPLHGSRLERIGTAWLAPAERKAVR